MSLIFLYFPILLQITVILTKNLSIRRFKEELKFNRVLQESTNDLCAYYDEYFEITFNSKIDNIDSVRLNNQTINNNNYNIIDNILKIKIPISNNLSQQTNNTLTINYNNNLNTFNYNIKLHSIIKVNESETILDLDDSNILKNDTIDFLNSIETNIQKFVFGEIELVNNTNQFDIKDNSISIYEKKIEIFNIKINKPVNIYKLYAKNICNNSLYELKTYKFYSKDITEHQFFMSNQKFSVLMKFVGTYEDKVITMISLVSSDQKKTFNSTDISFYNKTDSEYTLNVTFDLSNSKIYEDTLFFIYFENFKSNRTNNHYITIKYCEEPTIFDNVTLKCIRCKNLFSQLRQTCVEKCSYNEYQYKSNGICYTTCPEGLLGYKNICYQSCVGLSVNDLKEEGGKCVDLTFNLKSLSGKLSAQRDQIIVLEFEEDFPEERLKEISMDKVSSTKCNKNSKNFNCTIDLSSFKINKVQNYNISYLIKKGDGTELQKNSNITIKVNPSSLSCNKYNQIYNSSSNECEECNEGKYYSKNFSCINNCSEVNYFYLENENRCVKSCSLKVEYSDEEKYCLDNCENEKGYGYLYAYDENNCYKCESYEGLILKDGKCICEKEGYTNLRGECTKCLNISEGMIVKDGFCVCSSGYELNNDGKCINCSMLSEGMIEKDNKCVCDNGYHFNYTGDNKCRKIVDYENCREGYTGYYCDISINNIQEIENMISSIENQINEIISNLDEDMNIIELIEDENLNERIKQLSILYQYQPIKKNSILDIIKNLTINIIEYYNNNIDSITDSSTNLTEYIGLTLFYQKYALNSRRLENEKELSLLNIHQFYKNMINNQKLTIFKLNRISSVNHAFTNFIWNYTYGNYSGYVEEMTKLKSPYLKIENQDVSLILHTILNSSIITSRNLSNVIISSLYNKNNKIIEEPLIYSVDYKSFFGINNNLYSYYMSKGINIYNSDDQVFTDKCFRNYKLKYDLTTKYKKYSLYQGDIYFSCEESNSIDSLKNYYICDINTPFYYSREKDFTKIKLKDKNSGLPFKCIGKIQKFGKNIGFWVFFIIFVILISVTVLLILKGNNNSEKGEDEINRNYFIGNLWYFHPITTLFQESLLCPIQLKIYLFFFNFSSLFFFNELLYTEKSIEKRIYDKHRNSFWYPMKKEFGKIISSIIISMALIFIIKFLLLTDYNKNNELIEVNKMEYDIKKRLFNDFQKEKYILNLIICIITIIIMVFIWIYSIGFCNIYFFAQRSWVFSGFWSLILEWIIFAPLYLYIVSYFDEKGENKDLIISYYMKRLICF